jgi:hypothetical protein
VTFLLGVVTYQTSSGDISIVDFRYATFRLVTLESTIDDIAIDDSVRLHQHVVSGSSGFTREAETNMGWTSSKTWADLGLDDDILSPPS